MAVLTAHYGLIKPSPDDFYDIEVTNENTERIDQALYNLEQTKETPEGAQAKADQAKADAEAASIPLTAKGQANGVASLDGTGKVPSAQLPAMNYDPAGSAAAVNTKLTTHIADKANPHNVLPVQVGGIPIVTTSGTGAAYTAEVPGITELYAGLMITIIPHESSSVGIPTLNVNGLGEKYLFRPLSNTTSEALSAVTKQDWLLEGIPLVLQFDGGNWIAITFGQPVAEDLNGIVSVSKGGTGAATAAIARRNLGVAAADHTHTAAEINAVPTNRTVNGKALSANISLTAADVGSLPKTGGAFTGQVSGVSPTSGITKGFRNIYYGSGAPASSLGANGDIYIKIG